MILGSFMENLSGSGPAGIRIRDCFLPVRESRLVLALELASLAVLAGDGDIGDMIGTTTAFFSTATPTYPTAESLPIATTSIGPVDSMAAVLLSTALRPPIPSQAPTRARSVDLIMEEPRGAFPRAGSPASV